MSTRTINLDKTTLIQEISDLVMQIESKLQQYNQLAGEIQRLRQQFNRVHETAHYSFANFDVECPACQKMKQG